MPLKGNGPTGNSVYDKADKIRSAKIAHDCHRPWDAVHLLANQPISHPEAVDLVGRSSTDSVRRKYHNFQLPETHLSV